MTPQPPVTVENLWRGEAKLEVVRKLEIEPGGDAGSGWVTVHDGRWFWFYRDTPAAPRPAACPADYVRAVARVSDDGGASWGPKIVVAEPDAGTCTTLDGATHLDRANKTWHLLAQCLGRSDAQGGRMWHLCHFTRPDDARGPAGPYAADSANPVVRGGELFRRICATPGPACPAGVVDEGTPEILGKNSDGTFDVTFHGARYMGGNVVHGYRASARTRDFRNYEVGALMLGARDCASVSADCIGSGAATTLRGGDGYWYQLAETPTKSIGCWPGQYWPYTLFRARTLAATGGWELPAPARVPFLQPSAPDAACGLQYARWIDDPKRGLHLAVWDARLGHVLYRAAY